MNGNLKQGGRGKERLSEADARAFIAGEKPEVTNTVFAEAPAPPEVPSVETDSEPQPTDLVEIPEPDDDAPQPLDDSSDLQLRVIQLESDCEDLTRRNIQLVEANERLAAALASVSPQQAGRATAAGPKYVGRLAAPKLVPLDYRTADGRPDMKAITTALNADETLVIAGIERRS